MAIIWIFCGSTWWSAHVIPGVVVGVFCSSLTTLKFTLRYTLTLNFVLIIFKFKTLQKHLFYRCNLKYINKTIHICFIALWNFHSNRVFYHSRNLMQKDKRWNYEKFRKPMKSRCILLDKSKRLHCLIQNYIFFLVLQGEHLIKFKNGFVYIVLNIPHVNRACFWC